MCAAEAECVLLLCVFISVMCGFCVFNNMFVCKFYESTEMTPAAPLLTTAILLSFATSFVH